MQPVTVRTTPKPFTWSYSKIKNFEVCPKKYFHVDVEKDFREEESEQLKYGNELHKAMAERLEKGKDLPKPYADFEREAVRVLTPAGKIYVEQKYGLRQDLSACGYFDKGVWYRGIGDFVKVVGRVALITDWKTGKIKEDAAQLSLMAQCIFSSFPDVVACRAEFSWLGEGAVTRMDFKRSDMGKVWAGLMPRIAALQSAHETMTFPRKPGALCRRWCPVSACPNHGM